ncbi:hypothetical protein LJC19_07055 [Oxalobacter sp. OttesenSCG-928-P03]|nr:hypothetical protein [Oxalobacter sp. OttesenSCG-928-P03]
MQSPSQEKDVVFSKHAIARWKDRFPDRDMEEEFRSAKKRFDKKLLKKFKSHLANKRDYLERKQGRERQYRITKDGIVFLLAEVESEDRDVVVTTFLLQ